MTPSYSTTVINNAATSGLLILEAKKFFQCAQVSTSAIILDTADGTTRAVVIKVDAVGLECRKCRIECLAYGGWNGPREIVRVQLDRCQLHQFRKFRWDNSREKIVAELDNSYVDVESTTAILSEKASEL